MCLAVPGQVESIRDEAGLAELRASDPATPGREVVFLAIGFETTAPANEMAV